MCSNGSVASTACRRRSGSTEVQSRRPAKPVLPAGQAGRQRGHRQPERDVPRRVPERILVHEPRRCPGNMRGSAWRVQRGSPTQRDRQRAAGNAPRTVTGSRPAMTARPPGRPSRVVGRPGARQNRNGFWLSTGTNRGRGQWRLGDLGASDAPFEIPTADELRPSSNPFA